MTKWIISVGGHTYGPYTADQMQAFAVEGRLAAHSLVAREDDGRFGPAVQEAELGFLFQSRQPLATTPAREATHRSFGHAEERSDGEPSHFLIVADMKSGSITTLEEEICKIGPAYAVMPQAWILSCELSVGTLRNMLVQKMGKIDTLLVVDASNDKLSWSNLGMETETRVRRIWAKQQQLSVA